MKAALIVLCAVGVVGTISALYHKTTHVSTTAASTETASISTASTDSTAGSTTNGTDISIQQWTDLPESTVIETTETLTAPSETVSPETVADSQWAEDMYPGYSYMTVTGFPKSEAKWLGNNYSVLGYFLYRQCFTKYGTDKAEFRSMETSPKLTQRYYTFRIHGRNEEVVDVRVAALNSATDVPFTIVQTDVIQAAQTAETSASESTEETSETETAAEPATESMAAETSETEQ